MSDEEREATETDPRVLEMRAGFSNHTPSADGVRAIGKVRSATKLLGEVILENTPDGRLQERALEDLEDALMHATKSIALATGEPTDGKP